MIDFKKSENIKECTILKNGEEFISIELLRSSITNKYFIITDFIKRLSDFFCENEEFDDWLEYFVLEYQRDEENRYQLIVDNIPLMKYFVNEYYEHSGLDFSLFVDETKSKKTSILFKADEIKKIVIHSGYLKLYSLISNSNLRISEKLHKSVYNLFLSEVDDEIMQKIFNIIKTKTYKYSHTDSYMWEYLSVVRCKGIDLHIIDIFNFIMNSIIVICEEGRNPIIFFTTVVDESIKWILRSVYKTTVIYEDSISTESIQSMTLNNLKSYSYNDTFARLKNIAYQNIFTKIEKNSLTSVLNELEKDEYITDFQTRIKSIEYISPISEYFIYPLLSKAMDIPYKHFKTLSPEYSTIISYLMHDIFVCVFKNDYKNIIDLMLYYPINPPPISTTYKIKDIHNCINYQNSVNNFYGFKTKILSTNIMSNLIGRISRITFKSSISGQKNINHNIQKIEPELVKFFTKFWANNLNSEISELNKYINQLL